MPCTQLYGLACGVVGFRYICFKGKLTKARQHSQMMAMEFAPKRWSEEEVKTCLEMLYQMVAYGYQVFALPDVPFVMQRLFVALWICLSTNNHELTNSQTSEPGPSFR